MILHHIEVLFLNSFLKGLFMCVFAVLRVSEEYKLVVVQCMISLTKSVSWDVVTELYKKENTPKLCQVLYVALELAKNEKLRTLR